MLRVNSIAHQTLNTTRLQRKSNVTLCVAAHMSNRLLVYLLNTAVLFSSLRTIIYGFECKLQRICVRMQTFLCAVVET